MERRVGEDSCGDEKRVSKGGDEKITLAESVEKSRSKKPIGSSSRGTVAESIFSGHSSTQAHGQFRRHDVLDPLRHVPLGPSTSRSEEQAQGLFKRHDLLDPLHHMGLGPGSARSEDSSDINVAGTRFGEPCNIKQPHSQSRRCVHLTPSSNIKEEYWSAIPVSSSVYLDTVTFSKKVVEERVGLDKSQFKTPMNNFELLQQEISDLRYKENHLKKKLLELQHQCKRAEEELKKKKSQEHISEPTSYVNDKTIKINLNIQYKEEFQEDVRIKIQKLFDTRNALAKTRKKLHSCIINSEFLIHNKSAIAAEATTGDLSTYKCRSMGGTMSAFLIETLKKLEIKKSHKTYPRQNMNAVEQVKSKVFKKVNDLECKCEKTEKHLLELEFGLNSDVGNIKIKIQEVLKSIENLVDENRALHAFIQNMKGNIRVFGRLSPQLLKTKDQRFCKIKIDGSCINICKQGGENKMEAFHLDGFFRNDESKFPKLKEISNLIKYAIEGNNICILGHGMMTEELPGSENKAIISKIMEFISNEIEAYEDLGWNFKVSVNFHLVHATTHILSSKQNPKTYKYASLKKTTHRCSKILNRFLKAVWKNNIESAAYITNVNITGDFKQKMSTSTLNFIEITETILKSNTTLGDLKNIFLAIKEKEPGPSIKDPIVKVLEPWIKTNSVVLIILTLCYFEKNYKDTIKLLKYGESIKKCQSKV